MPIIDPYADYLAAGTSFSRMVSGVTGVTGVYGIFNEDRRPLLPFVDTGLVYPGPGGQQDPSLLKYFNKIRFGGRGKVYVRAMVDGTEVQRGYATLSEDPNHADFFKFPIGTCGYGIQLQIVGIAWWRFYEILWEPVTPEVKE